MWSRQIICTRQGQTVRGSKSDNQGHSVYYDIILNCQEKLDQKVV